MELVVADIFDRLVKVTGEKNISQILKKYGYNPTKAGTWKSRNTVPWELCLQVSLETGAPLEWLTCGNVSKSVMNVANLQQESQILRESFKEVLETACGMGVARWSEGLSVEYFANLMVTKVGEKTEKFDPDK